MLRRYEQYQMALANDREFQKKYMFSPQIKLSRKETRLIDADEGVTPTTAEGLARLKPVEPGRRPQLRGPDLPRRRQLRLHRDHEG